MKKILLQASLILFCSYVSFGQKEELEAIKKVNKQWLDCFPNRDSATLRNILAGDFIMIDPNGSSQNKQNNLKMLMSPDMETLSVTIDSVNVRLLSPAIGVLYGWCHFTFKVNGNEMKGKTSYQDIYMKRKGKWVAVSAHVAHLE